MNSNLAPTYQKLSGGYWILWYAISNSYSVIDQEFKSLLQTYLDSKSLAEFKTTISTQVHASEHHQITETLYNYLKNSNVPYTPLDVPTTPIDLEQRHIAKQYVFGDKTIQVYYNSEQVLKTVHPSLAHYDTGNGGAEPVVTFDIYLKNDYLFLYKDKELITCVSKQNYHFIQGKFTMLLLCAIHNKKEQDWIGTFHGSTITDNNSSILFVGESGKGKSTLCALLAANGFNMLADDVSPMLSKDRQIYFNPSGISIKEGAFNVLQPIIVDFETLPITTFNKAKGNLKYIPTQKPSKNHYPCRAIVLVNYESGADTRLEFATVKTILETIIPESWLSPNPDHAQQFLNWFTQIELYHLTYSDTASVIDEISNLFHRLNSNNNA